MCSIAIDKLNLNIVSFVNPQILFNIVEFTSLRGRENVRYQKRLQEGISTSMQRTIYCEISSILSDLPLKILQIKFI